MCDNNEVEVVDKSPPSHILEYDPSDKSFYHTVTLKYFDLFHISLWQCQPNREASLTAFLGGVEDSGTYTAVSDESVTDQFGDAISFHMEKGTDELWSVSVATTYQFCDGEDKVPIVQ